MTIKQQIRAEKKAEARRLVRAFDEFLWLHASTAPTEHTQRLIAEMAEKHDVFESDLIALFERAWDEAEAECA